MGRPVVQMDSCAGIHRTPAVLLGAAVNQMAPADDSWAAAWIEAAAGSWDRVEAALDGSARVRTVKDASGHAIQITDSWGLLEPLLAATLLRGLPPDVALYASSSMPVRDITSFWPPAAPPRRVLVNRGANGIDGVVSSALGAALALDRPVAAVVGDVALLHDIGGLLAATLSDADLTVVVPNNDGGGIFSLLPVAQGAADIHFGELFHTPHGVGLGKLAVGLGVNYHRTGQADDLVEAITKATGGDVDRSPHRPRDSLQAAQTAS